MRLDDLRAQVMGQNAYIYFHACTKVCQADTSRVSIVSLMAWRAQTITNHKRSCHSVFNDQTHKLFDAFKSPSQTFNLHTITTPTCAYFQTAPKCLHQEGVDGEEAAEAEAVAETSSNNSKQTGTWPCPTPQSNTTTTTAETTTTTSEDEEAGVEAEAVWTPTTSQSAPKTKP